MSYAPDKQGPEADARKAEAAAYIEQLRAKYGVPFHQLYPIRKERREREADSRAGDRGVGAEHPRP